MKLKDCKPGMSVNTQSGPGIILPDREDYITYEWTLEFNALRRISIPRKAVGICLQSGTTIFALPENITPYRHHEPTHYVRFGDLVSNMISDTNYCRHYGRLEPIILERADLRTETP